MNNVSLLDQIFSQLPDTGDSNDGNIRLVVGLGNPGPAYEATRHNIGFELVNKLAKARDLNWKKDRKFRAQIASVTSSLVLAKPITFMNLSGNAVARLARFHKLGADQILAVYDDVDLPLGRMRFRASGSAGGHNGIKSIIECLGTDAFPRLKIGIGSAGGQEAIVGHVLGRFNEEEWDKMQKVLAIAVDGVNCALSDGLNAAMNQFNRRTE